MIHTAIHWADERDQGSVSDCSEIFSDRCLSPHRPGCPTVLSEERCWCPEPKEAGRVVKKGYRSLEVADEPSRDIIGSSRASGEEYGLAIGVRSRPRTRNASAHVGNYLACLLLRTIRETFFKV